MAETLLLCFTNICMKFQYIIWISNVDEIEPYALIHVAKQASKKFHCNPLVNSIKHFLLTPKLAF